MICVPYGESIIPYISWLQNPAFVHVFLKNEADIALEKINDELQLVSLHL
jgi:hypothetical protein